MPKKVGDGLTTVTSIEPTTNNWEDMPAPSGFDERWHVIVASPSTGNGSISVTKLDGTTTLMGPYPPCTNVDIKYLDNGNYRIKVTQS